jgi:hypothetical protein
VPQGLASSFCGVNLTSTSAFHFTDHFGSLVGEEILLFLHNEIVAVSVLQFRPLFSLGTFSCTSAKTTKFKIESPKTLMGFSSSRVKHFYKSPE